MLAFLTQPLDNAVHPRTPDIHTTSMFIFTVPQNHCAIVEMFGKPRCVKRSGLNFYIPFLQSLKDVTPMWGSASNKSGIFIELSEQQHRETGRTCTTKDNVIVQVSCIIRWKITDPIKAVYSIDHLHRSLVEVSLNELRSLIGNMELDAVLTGRSALSEKVTLAVSPTLQRWGITLTTVEIQELSTDQATADAMRQIIEAERRSKAISAEAVGESSAKIKLAEAEKQATILRAQGLAEALKLEADAQTAYLRQLAEVIGAEAAAKVLINRQTIEGYSTITKDPNAKVYLPSNLPAIVNIKD